MITIEVKSNQVKTIDGTSRNTGKPFSMRKQQAYAVLPDRAYPVEIELTLEPSQPAYEAGNYTLSEHSLYVDKYGSLAMGRPVLIQQLAQRLKTA